MPQYWCAISWANVRAMPRAESWVMSPISGSNASVVMNMMPGGAWPKPKSLISRMSNSSNGNGPRKLR